MEIAVSDFDGVGKRVTLVGRLDILGAEQIALPASAASRPRMTRMVVDLPAPFGPTNPVTSPGATVNVIPSRACVGPKRLRRPVTSIVVMPGVV